MILKIALVLAVIVLAFTFFRKKKPKVEETPQEVPAVEMKQDPICNIYVEDTTKFKVKYYDKIYYFCSEECKNKFVESKKEA